MCASMHGHVLSLPPHANSIPHSFSPLQPTIKHPNICEFLVLLPCNVFGAGIMVNMSLLVFSACSILVPHVFPIFFFRLLLALS